MLTVELFRTLTQAMNITAIIAEVRAENGDISKDDAEKVGYAIFDFYRMVLTDVCDGDFDGELMGGSGDLPLPMNPDLREPTILAFLRFLGKRGWFVVVTPENDTNAHYFASPPEGQRDVRGIWRFTISFLDETSEDIEYSTRKPTSKDLVREGRTLRKVGRLYDAQFNPISTPA